MMLERGATFPIVDLLDSSGAVASTRSLRGRPLVLTYYLEDDTPTCTRQVCDLDAAFAHRGTESNTPMVVGVSPDSPESHLAFRRKAGLKLTLLTDDRDEAGIPRLANALGLWGEKVLYGNRVIGIRRATFVVDATGTIRGVLKSLARNHAARVQTLLDACGS